jgi:PAS domain S-box-containing protein
MSPFSSPPQSPLPAHFRKHADGVSPSASPYPAIHNKAIAKTQHLDANRKGSAAKSTSSGGGGSSGSADEKTLAIRRRKHNELEIKRRKKMNEKYEELCQLLGCSHTRLGILETAISKIKSADAQVRALNIILDATKKDLNHSHSSNSKAVSSTDFSFNLPALNETPVLASSANEIITKMSNSIRELKCPAMITALNGSILSFNSAVPKMLGFSDEILTKSTLFSVISEADLSKMFALTNRVLSGEVSSEVIDLKMVHSQGYTVSLRSFITAIFHKAAQKTTSIESSLFESQELSVPSEKIIALLLLFTVENETI